MAGAHASSSPRSLILYLSPSAICIRLYANGCHSTSGSGCPIDCELVLAAAASLRRFLMQICLNSLLVIARRVHWSPKA